MASKNLKIAFIGTGIMGAPIAGHIMDAGYELTVYNRTKEKAADLIERGAAWADSVAEAAKDADVVFTMVGFPTDVEEVYLAGEGLLAFGGAGKGQAAKLSNQVALASAMVGMADALSFAQQNDLDVEQVREMICSGTGSSGAMQQLAPKAIDGDYKPGFLVEHFLKDLGLALTVAEEKELALPGADTAFTLYDMLDAIGGGRMGTQAITLLYQEEAEAVAAGLDWSLYAAQHEHDDECDCGCGHDHGHEHGGHECACGHGHGEDHECCGGHGHGEGHECHCGHHHEG